MADNKRDFSQKPVVENPVSDCFVVGTLPDGKSVRRFPLNFFGNKDIITEDELTAAMDSIFGKE